MTESFKIITKKSGLALLAAIAVVSVASPASAQSYSFPTYAYTHPATGSAANPLARNAGLYNTAPAANIAPAVELNALVSSAARGASR